MGHIIYSIFMVICFSLVSCGELEDFNNAQRAYYMPPIDLYVVRGNTGANKFQVSGGGNAYEFIMRSFTGDDVNSVNYYLGQLGITFHHSAIRLFYINVPFQIAETGGLFDLMDENSFQLTNEAGDQNKGTVYNENGPLRIFFIGDTNPPALYAGLGTVGFGGVLIVSNSGYSSNIIFSLLLTHELGHNLGLVHPFNSGGNPNPQSCDPAYQGTTNRIMDYVSMPTYFSPCERIIASTRINEKTDFEVIYDPTQSAHTQVYIGDWAGTITVGQPWINQPIGSDIQIEVD